tara:strand:- start:417 stop:911 length:495 start_codon:yes stop_codon:yes gene_type:complete
MIGMFFMPSTSAQSAELQVDQLVYEKIPYQSVITKFFGYVDDTNKNARVLLTITSPDGDISKNRVYPTGTGYFEFFHSLDRYAELGTYKVIAEYKDETIGVLLFDLVEDHQTITENSSLNQMPKIPSWAKNIFIWYGQDKISEDELLTAIEFLINDGLIKVKSV